MKLLSLIATAVVFFGIAGPAYVAEPEGDAEAAIDQHSLKASPEDEASLDKLARYLKAPCKGDRDEARAIYRWITDRIAYNAEGFFSGKPGDNSPQAVLKKRRAVCEGYSALFVSLGERMKLNVVKVTGYAKGAGYVRGKPVAKGERHAWVAVQIQGEWHLVDPTWGAGYLKGRKYVKHFTNYYFLPPPDQLIFTHLPNEARWQLLKTHLSIKEFNQQPKIGPSLFELGVSSEAARSAIAEKSFRELVQTYSHPSKATRLVKAPLKKYLAEGKEYEFVFESDDYAEMAIFNEGAFTPMKRDGKSFSATVMGKKGMLHVSGRIRKDDKLFSWVVGYVVE